ncbi:autotransporter outer membrane beta-barrel domain-containing protein [Campylobacter mucosalis]|uniref:Putative autotransporter beta-domain protein n=1 Tax=Campylobacter mucosalis CCUG 21559 TaxID=1032067 RepID=A0A6G5QIX0_9BACT|nr:autotransporter outer membrane beta-barrel domain-containing protein [Campylobacter mucosalis]QCD45559.1 putative autotransporter beta-domain protein [Campylobacter mucosalis CCUG 21559]
MKFSKIACVALLSASISTVALADNDQLTGLLSAKNYQATKEAAYQAVISAVKELKTIGYANLKNWNGDKTGDGANKLSAELNTRIYNALEKIKDVKIDLAPNSNEIPIESGESKLVITDSGDIKLLIKGDDNTEVNGGVGDQELTLSLEKFKNGGGDHDKIAKMFADNNKDVWDKLIEEFTKKHNELKASRDDIIDASVKNLVENTSSINDPDEKYTAFVENKDFILNNIRNNIKKGQANVAEKQKELNQAIADVPKDKLTLSGTDIVAIKKQEAAIKELENKLTAAKNQNGNNEDDVKAKADALIAAIDAGARLKRKNTEETLLTKEDIENIKNGTAKGANFDGGQTDLNDDTKKAAVLKALIGDNAGSNSMAFKAVADAKIEIEKVAIAVTVVTTAEGNLAVVNKLMTDADKAIATITSSEEIVDAKLDALNKAVKQKKPAITIKTAQQELKNAANARATGVTKVANLEEKQGEVLGSFTDTVLANDTVKSIVTTYDAKELADTAKALNTSIEQSQRSQNKGTSTDIIMFNTGLATNTRLAKLSNPFNADLALAQAINELEGETFADAGDSLSSVIKEYTNRFNHDNNLWGNIFGGKGKIKDSANPSIWGVTLGYDKAFDNTIVGGFINYAKVQSKDSQVRSESDNYSFGVYSRSYFDQSEIDAKIGYGFGRNELSRHAMDSKIGTSTGKYDSKFFDVDVEYGYVFGLGNAMFIKPIAGLSYTHIKHDGFTEDGNVPAIFGNTTLKTLKAKLGSEFRVYTDNAGYFYITPGVERELSKSANDLSVKFVGSSKDVVFDADKKKNTYITLKTGAEFKITNNLSTNINFGAKAKAKEQYYNGTLGVSYKF